MIKPTDWDNSGTAEKFWDHADSLKAAVHDSHLARSAAEHLAGLSDDQFRLPLVVQDVEAILDLLTARMKAARRIE